MVTSLTEVLMLLGRKFGAPKPPRATQPPLPQKGKTEVVEKDLAQTQHIFLQVLNKQNIHVCYDKYTDNQKQTITHQESVPARSS